MEEDIRKSIMRLAVAKRKALENASTPVGEGKGGIDRKLEARRTPEVSPVTQAKRVDPKREEMTDESELSLIRKFMVSMEARTATADLPKISPGQFAGDFLEFPRWWATFQTAIDEQPIPDSKKLLHLLAYTDEPVKSLVAGFITPRKNPLAYKQATTLLHTRYGNPMLVADAFKRRLEDWPCIEENDGEELTRFSDFLWQCFAAMESLTYLQNLNSVEENRKLVSKLPPSVGTRWTRKLDRTLFRYDKELSLNVSVLSGQYPSFEEFCQYVSDEARIASGPCIAIRKKEKKLAIQSANTFQIQSEMRPRSNTAPGSMKPPRCGFCQGSHYLYLCETFLNNTRAFKEQYARDQGLCYLCLRRGHRQFECTIKNHTLMQDPAERKATSLSVSAAEFIPRQTETQEATCHAIGSGISLEDMMGDMDCSPAEDKGVNCKRSVKPVDKPASTESSLEVEAQNYTTILPVWVKLGDIPEEEVLTYAAVDSQSDCSFVSAELADKLNLTPSNSQEMNLKLNLMGTETLAKSYRSDDLILRGEFERKQYRLRKCYIKDEIPVSKDAIFDPKDAASWHHVKDLAKVLPAKREDMEIGMLIGYTCPESLVTCETRESSNSALYGIRTKFGWLFVGRAEAKGREVHHVQHCFKTTSKEVTQEDIMTAFGLDFQQPKNPTEKRSSDDELFMKIMREGVTQLQDGHFQLPLPLRKKPEELDLPDSRAYARHCLESVQKKMRRDAAYRKMYNEFMEQLIFGGMAELVDHPDEIDPRKAWYWAHHGVTHPRKPGVIRGVFNGSARIRGIALNDLLLAGPDQMNSLVGILIRFRRHMIPVTCDIEKMFFQVYVDPEYRDLLRFYWFKDRDPDGEVLVYRMKVHLFGATSNPGCANFALKETANLFQEKYGKEAADLIRDNFYVDDGLGGADSGEATALIKNTRGLCREGGFNLQKYTCGDRETLKGIPEDWVSPNIRSAVLGDEKFGSDKPLGVELDLDTDEFIFRAGLKEFQPTRRSLLSCLSSVFDLLGLISPALLKGRQFLQSLCIKKLDWDFRIAEEDLAVWVDWYVNMENIETIQICRKLRRKTEQTAQD